MLQEPFSFNLKFLFLTSLNAFLVIIFSLTEINLKSSNSLPHMINYIIALLISQSLDHLVVWLLLQLYLVPQKNSHQGPDVVFSLVIL